MQTDEDTFFFDIQPGASGVTLSHLNSKSSVLCPKTQDITSQYLILQQLDAHHKMVARAKGVVDTTPPKSLQSYRSVSSQQKRQRIKQVKSISPMFGNYVPEDKNGPIPNKPLPGYNAEEYEDGSSNTSLLNKAIQTGIPASDFTSKTAEKISWYLEALSLGELQSEYFTSSDGNHMKQLPNRQILSKQGQKKVTKGDIMDWHRKYFVEPKKPFSPSLLADPDAKSKVRDMRCYNPPFRVRRERKTLSSQSSDTFESTEEDNEEMRDSVENQESFQNTSDEEEIQMNRHSPDDTASRYSYKNSTSLYPHFRRGLNSYSNPELDKNEEEKYLDFLSKVTEDISRSGLYSDKAIQQAFEFHMQFYKDDPDKEKLQSLLQQVLEGLKITNEDSLESFHHRKPFKFSLSGSSTPPEKESPGDLLASDSLQEESGVNTHTSEYTHSVNGLDNS